MIGSAVNPVLREGNSDRRVAGPVKEFARANPHRLKDWSGDSKTEVKSMPDDDFFGSEKSSVRAAAGSLRVELHAADGSVTVLKDGIPVAADEIFDAARLSRAKLGDFVEAELQRAAKDGVMVSLHLKATMMKVSDPILFGAVVATYFKKALENAIRSHPSTPTPTVSSPSSTPSSLCPTRRRLRLICGVLHAARPPGGHGGLDKGITNLRPLRRHHRRVHARDDPRRR